MYALIDCNNFFVSCERLFRPDLETKPVAVLSNNDGCFISRSNEVKALGIPMGAPLFKYQDIVTKNKVVTFSSNFRLYGDISARVIQTLESLTPSVEVYSIDECFLDLSGIDSPHTHAQNIRLMVKKWVGIPTCIGIAPTKTLAKIANHFAKKNSAFDGVCSIQTETEITGALMAISVQDIWGIGRNIADALLRAGIRTGWDLYNADRNWIRKKFTVTGERLWMELHGTPCYTVQETPAAKQSIQVTRSFSKGLTSLEELRIAVAGYASRAGEKLRKSNQRTRHLMVYIRTNKFRPQDPQLYQSAMITFPFPIYDDLGITTAACKVLETLYKPGYKYHKAGVVLMDFCPMTTIQLNLFSKSPSPEHENRLKKLNQAMDSLNRRYGRSTIVHGVCGTDVKWRDRKERISPAYTTRWDEILTVK